MSRTLTQVPLTPESAQNVHNFKLHDTTPNKITFFRQRLHHERNVDLWVQDEKLQVLISPSNNRVFFPTAAKAPEESPVCIRKNELVFHANQSLEICYRYLKRFDPSADTRNTEHSWVLIKPSQNTLPGPTPSLKAAFILLHYISRTQSKAVSFIHSMDWGLSQCWSIFLSDSRYQYDTCGACSNTLTNKPVLNLMERIHFEHIYFSIWYALVDLTLF